MGDDMAIHLPTNVRGALLRACMQDNRGYVRICTYMAGYYDTDGMGRGSLGGHTTYLLETHAQTLGGQAETIEDSGHIC